MAKLWAHDNDISDGSMDHSPAGTGFYGYYITEALGLQCEILIG